MANTAAPFGFRQFGQREGTAPTAGLERLLITSSDTNLYFTGDVVAISSYSLVAGTISPVSSVVANAVAPVGVFLGCEYYNSNVGRTVWNSFWPGNQGSSTFYNAYVCTNPQQLYIVQATSNAVCGSSMIGSLVTHSVTGSSLGSQTTGQSVQTILSSVAVTGLSSNGPWKVVDVYANYAPPGVNGTSTGAEGLQILVVQPNAFSRNVLTGVST
jgi:hypothetical protein